MEIVRNTEAAQIPNTRIEPQLMRHGMSSPEIIGTMHTVRIMEAALSRRDTKTADDISAIFDMFEKRYANNPGEAYVLNGILEDLASYSSTDYEKLRFKVSGLSKTIGFINKIEDLFCTHIQETVIKFIWNNARTEFSQTLEETGNAILDTALLYKDPDLAIILINRLCIVTGISESSKVLQMAKVLRDAEPVIDSFCAGLGEENKRDMFGSVLSLAEDVKDAKATEEILRVVSLFNDSPHIARGILTEICKITSTTPRPGFVPYGTVADIEGIKEFIKELDREVFIGKPDYAEWLSSRIVRELEVNRVVRYVSDGMEARAVNDVKDEIIGLGKEFGDVPDVAVNVIRCAVANAFSISPFNIYNERNNITFTESIDILRKSKPLFLKMNCLPFDESPFTSPFASGNSLKNEILDITIYAALKLQNYDVVASLAAFAESISGSGDEIKNIEELIFKDLLNYIRKVYEYPHFDVGIIKEYIISAAAIKLLLENPDIYSENPKLKFDLVAKILDMDIKREAPQNIMSVMKILCDSEKSISEAFRQFGNKTETRKTAINFFVNAAMNTHDKKVIEYYAGLFKENASFADSDFLIVSSDFVESIRENFSTFSTIQKIHAMCAVIWQHKGAEGIRGIRDEKAAYEAIGNILRENGVSIEGLSDAQMFVILRSFERGGIKQKARSLNRIIKGNGATFGRRLEGLGFNEPLTTKIGHMELKDAENFASLEETVMTMVLGINGSRANGYDASRYRLVQAFGAMTVGKALNAWLGIRKKHMKRLIKEYEYFKSHPSKESAARVIKVFEDSLDDIRDKDKRDALGKIVSAFYESLGSGKIEAENRIIAYTVKGKANAINISSRVTVCCCFMPDSLHDHAWMNYILDPGVVLINFSIAKTRAIARLEELPIHGFAIGVLGTIKCLPGLGDKEERVFFVDSVEGGSDLKKALKAKKTGFSELFGLIEKGARMINAEWLAINTKPSYDLPEDFVNSLPMQEKTVYIKPLIDRKQYLEGFGGVFPRKNIGAFMYVFAKLKRLD